MHHTVVLCCVSGSQGKAFRQIVIQPTNDPPVVVSTKSTVQEDSTVTVSLPVVDPEGDAVSFRLGCLPKKGTVAFISDTLLDGQLPFSYTPDPEESGTDTFVIGG